MPAVPQDPMLLHFIDLQGVLQSDNGTKDRPGPPYCSAPSRSPAPHQTGPSSAQEIGHFQQALGELAKGASVNAVGNNNWTALHAAAWTDRVEIVRLLLESGADTRIRWTGDPRNYRNGATALDLARGNRETAALLERASGQVGLYGQPKYDSPMQGKVGLPFSKRPTAPCRGGHWNTHVNVATGALPPGLRLSGTTIEGVPSRPGTWHFSVRFSSLTCAGKSYADVTQDVTIVTEGSAAPRRVQ
jgi:hypothetical protein